MALFVWTMVGLALWHFTVFLPDNFYGGIVGAFCGALLGSVIFGLLVNLGDPGPERHRPDDRRRGHPGRAAGMGLMWWLGVRQMRSQGGSGSLITHRGVAIIR